MLKHIAGGMQWAIFMIAISLAAPIAIAHLFGMDAENTALFVQRTLFVLGLGSLIQAVFGHKLPINEGPAGLWWGVFVVYAGMSGVLYATQEATLQALQSGMIYSGILFIVFAMTGVAGKMKRLFTPTVTFVYLMLLILQLSGTFLNGMFGIEEPGDPIDPIITAGSGAVLVLSVFCMNRQSGLMQRYSVLLSIASGWVLFYLLGKADKPVIPNTGAIEVPNFLVFGELIWDSGLFVTAFFITILLIANMMASVRVMENLYRQQFSIEANGRMKQGAVVSGINHLLSGFFSAIGPVPIAGAAGFVSATRMTGIIPFALGSLFILLISLFPAVFAVLSALPAAVAYSVTFVIFTKMVEMAFHELSQAQTPQESYKVAAYGLMTGVGLMFMPLESMEGLPSVLSATLSNGLITGTVIAIGVEQGMDWRKRRQTRRSD